ncbi:MAG: FGGY family carbohydrate kinase [bacterium]|nr:FGGY family carbohydrate kinase [bacterium]
MNVLAVDAGTTAVKAATTDSAGGVQRGVRAAVDRGTGPGLDPEHSWRTVARAIAQVADSSAPVDAVTVTGQGDGLWTLGKSGAPAGPALEWNSTLAGEVVAQWERDGTIARHYARSATVLWPGTAAALWRWTRQHRPQTAAETQNVFCAKDWINHRLCGAIATDITDATIPFLDIFSGCYDEQAFSSLGCEDLAAAMAPIVPAGTQIGVVTEQAAAETSLAEGTPVLMGAIDVVAMTRGAGVSEPGQAVAVLGTTAAAMAVTDSLDTGGEPVGATLRIDPDEQRFLRVMGASSGTSTLDWFLSRFYSSPDSAHDSFWDDVQAAQPGVVMLPYLAGERAPFLAPQATGTFIGVTSRTNRAELARSVALGITFSLRHCVEHAVGKEPETVVLTGGGTTSATWCQLVADVIGAAVVVDDRPHTACAGAAAIAAGRSPSAPTERPRFEPRRDYGADFQEFVDITHALRPIWKEMNRQ